MTNNAINTTESASDVSYEVWAFGYTSEHKISDTEIFLADFENPEEAVDFAKKLSYEDIAANNKQYITDNTAYLIAEVETVVPDTENFGFDEDGNFSMNEDLFVNVGTIYASGKMYCC